MENNKLVIIASVVAVVLIAGGAIALANNNNNSSDSQVEKTQSSAESTSNMNQESSTMTQSNIVELAQSTSQLSTLVAAVVKADLAKTLSGDGPFTVFAPTNEAFASLLSKLGITADELLAREDLAAILTYHVVSGKVMAADLSNGQVVKTVQGNNLTVSISETGVSLIDSNGNDSHISTTDIEASNGVVHLIDAVVLP